MVSGVFRGSDISRAAAKNALLYHVRYVMFEKVVWIGTKTEREAAAAGNFIAIFEAVG